MRIPVEELQKHNVSLNHIEDDERGTYETYLKQTDYVALKIAEGVSTKEDYATELAYRQIAREELN